MVVIRQQPQHGNAHECDRIPCKKLASIGSPLNPALFTALIRTPRSHVIALEDRAYYDLVEQFRERTINRRYQSIIYATRKKTEERFRSESAVRIGQKEDVNELKKRKRGFYDMKVIERFHGQH